MPCNEEKFAFLTVLISSVLQTKVRIRPNKEGPWTKNRKKEQLQPELVSSGMQDGNNQQILGKRTSARVRKPNQLLEDYVWKGGGAKIQKEAKEA